MMLKRGRKFYFPPEGKVALMFLKMNTKLSAPKLIGQLNGNVNYQIICDIDIKPMDTSRIIQSTIPDIAAVYGGVRGRTLSSKHLGWVWQMLVEDGVRTVIELRSEDSSQWLPLKCASLGLRYFHFPVHKHGRSAPQMVELFEEFCEIIDGGDFYIACAQGLHRTDIALCTYWMFYGADHGRPKPELRGYLESEGKDLVKIFQTLNAFYRCKTERDGVPPISEVVFKERKQLIKEAWKQ